jgi:hypothetical protein
LGRMAGEVLEDVINERKERKERNKLIINNN